MPSTDCTCCPNPEDHKELIAARRTLEAAKKWFGSAWLTFDMVKDKPQRPGPAQQRDQDYEWVVRRGNTVP